MLEIFELTSICIPKVRLLVPKDILSLYSRMKLNKGKTLFLLKLHLLKFTFDGVITDVLANPNMMWCPFPGCENICFLPSTRANPKRKKLLGVIPLKRRKKTRKNSGQSVLCTTCNYLFCSQCKGPSHPDVPCSSFGQFTAPLSNILNYIYFI